MERPRKTAGATLQQDRIRCHGKNARKEYPLRRYLQRNRQGPWQQNQTQRNQRELRGNIEKAVRHISGDHRGWARAARNPTARRATSPPIIEGRNQRAEQPAGVTLRACREIKLCARSVHHRVPLSDASRHSHK